MKIKINLKQRDLTRNVMKRVNNAMETAMYDIVDHAVYLSSNIAPIDNSYLRKGHTEGVMWRSSRYVVGHISYSAYEQHGNGTFNYAQWIHEEKYKLGEKSRKAPGATGWSGKSYKVGNKYLERAVNGEHAAFTKYMKSEIVKELG